MRYRKKRTYSMSPCMAYLVGLITSDGSLSKDGRHLNLTSKDNEILLNACEIIGRSFKIKSKTSSTGGIANFIDFSDVALYDFFLSLGLMPNKSKILHRIAIPDEYFGDFLRGAFDGDGTTYAYYDKRWRSSYMYYWSLYSGSKQYLKWIRDKLTDLYGVDGRSIRASTRTYKLTYAKKDTVKIYEAMYTSSLCNKKLTRKYEKLSSFLSEKSMLES